MYSENALKIYERLYYTKDEKTPVEVHARVANAIGNNEKEIKEFEQIMNEGAFRPNSPTLMNAGIPFTNSWDGQLTACFVLGLEDSMESIIELWSVCAKIFAGGSGAGIPITNLRHKGASIAGGFGKASGPLKYLQVVDTVAQTVKSGGKHRRAALMATFKHDHPDILEILNSKSSGDLSSFNISMLVTNTFMNQIVDRSTNHLTKLHFDKWDDVDDIETKRIWRTFINNAWNTGDPGLLFYNTANAFSKEKGVEVICGNACNEIMLPAWSICCLGSINLNNCLIDNNTKFSFEILTNYIHLATIFLNNIIDKNSYIHEKFKKTAMEQRPIGVGLMGFADILYKLRIPYNSAQAIELFSNICQNLTKESIRQSIKLAKEKGSISLPKEFRKYIEYFTNDLKILEDFDGYGIYNTEWTSLPPTGSVGLSADCSYSFEPHFALVYEKQIAESNEKMLFINQEFEKWIDNYTIESQYTYSYKERIIQQIKNNKGSCQGISDIPKKIQEVFVTAHDISPLDKLKMQAAGQRFISQGISSTCNLPNSATKEDVEDIFITAWRLGLKGITVYRDGCKENQPISFGQKECKETLQEMVKALPPEGTKYQADFIKKGIINKNPTLMQRPIKRTGETCEINTPHGRLFITGNKTEDGKLFETFLRIGKQGSLNNLLIDALSRCISKSLQSGLSLDIFTDTLRGNKEIPFRFKLEESQEEPFYAESLVDAVGIVFQEVFLKEKTRNENSEILKLCPNCGKWGVDPSGCPRGGICVFCSFSNCM